MIAFLFLWTVFCTGARVWVNLPVVVRVWVGGTIWEILPPVTGWSQHCYSIYPVVIQEGHTICVLPGACWYTALHAPKGKMLFRSRAIHLVIMRGKQWKKCSVKTLVGWPLAATYPHSSLLTAPFPVAWRGNRGSKIKKTHGLRSGKFNRWWKGGGGNLVDAKAITYCLPQERW